jgi:alkyldihydroxyacetonephosphate synthase
LLEIVRAHRGLFTGELVGRLWRKSRFLTPYLRNTLWECGYALDTLETALSWPEVLPAAAAIKLALQQGGQPEGGQILVFAHLSHVYPLGASVYVTYIFPRLRDPDETLERWVGLKAAASRAILAHGGTISHQHGIGLDHAPYLVAEKGSLGLSILRAAMHSLDPAGLMNPGKLLIETDKPDIDTKQGRSYASTRARL